MLYRVKDGRTYYMKASDAVKAGKREGKTLEVFGLDNKSQWTPYEPKEYEVNIAEQEITIENIKAKKYGRT